MEGSFSVYWFSPDGEQHRDLYLGSWDECQEAVERLVRGPAARLGVVREVRVTDSMDLMLAQLKRTETGWVNLAAEKRST